MAKFHFFSREQLDNVLLLVYLEYGIYKPQEVKNNIVGQESKTRIFDFYFFH